MSYYYDDDGYRRKGPGRPRKYYNARKNAYCLKLTDKEVDMLEDLKEDLSKSSQDVLRYLLHSYYCEHYYGKEYHGL